jgi:hypothetical protein
MNVYAYPQSSYSCNGKPNIPYNGLSRFEFDASVFSSLTIEQKTTNNRNGGPSISYYVSFNSIITNKET